MSQAPGPGQGYYSYEIISDQPTYEKAIEPLGKSGSGLFENLMGAGALFEGIGQLARGLRGEPPAPMGMATRSLSDYLNQGRQDSMLAKLIEQLTEDNTGVELNLKPGTKDITRVTGGAS